ncbi:FAD/NAD(P)-binding protein [Cellvibrio mixtus]|uniref:FAD/NAD(P)-binding protein n=1 Tax=Cellvibrio mixtus TaxID=39650 RepID=UPI000A011544|nr:FAD/NAD(P)-binding protein [Cellvibrio mixtus]
MPDTLHRKNLVIIGCGASAVILLAALAKLHAATKTPSLTIKIVDDNPAAPRGLAYAVTHPSLVLNVPAQRMGVYTNDPAHFYQWLQQSDQWRQLHPDFSDLIVHPDDFVPRMIYGEYLCQVLKESVARLEQCGNSIEFIAERAITVNAANDNGVCITTNQHRNLIADSLVVATGNYPAFHNPVTSHSIFASPYCVSANACDWQQQRDLVLIGSGLSAVDAVQMALSRGFKGRFHVFSGHGLLPLAHQEVHHQQMVPVFNSNAQSARTLLRDVRAYIRSNQQTGIAWQDSINQLRALNNQIWSNLPEKERVRIRKFFPWWNVARHRIPAKIYQRLTSLEAQGRLRIHKAKVTRIDAVANGFQLTLYSNKALSIHSRYKKVKVLADKAMICAGYAPGFRFTQLLCIGLLKDENQLCAELGKPEHNFSLSAQYEIYGIGPALGGVLFETTAIHEIRQQAHSIAVSLYSNNFLPRPNNVQDAIALITPAL